MECKRLRQVLLPQDFNKLSKELPASGKINPDVL